MTNAVARNSSRAVHGANSSQTMTNAAAPNSSSAAVGASSSQTDVGIGHPRTAGHTKRLKSYMKGSLGSILALMGAIYTSLIPKNQQNTIFIVAASVCLVLGFFFTYILFLLSEGTVASPSEGTTVPSRNCFAHRHEHFYIAIYGSTLTLMLGGYFLLLFVNVKYAPLAIFPFLTFVILTILYYRGYKCGHADSAFKYKDHDAKLNYYCELSSAVTAAAFVGVLTYIYSSPTPPQQHGDVKPTEIALYIAIVISLLLMQLTTLPPAVDSNTARADMVRAIIYLSYIMVGVLIFVALLATGEVLQGNISTSIYVAGIAIFVVVIILNIIMEDPSGGNETVQKLGHDSSEMVVAGFAFGVIMVVYSTYVDDRTKVDGQFFILRLCLISLCTSLIISLSKALFLSHGSTFEAWGRAKMIMNYIGFAFALVAAVSFMLTRVL